MHGNKLDAIISFETDLFEETIIINRDTAIINHDSLGISFSGFNPFDGKDQKSDYGKWTMKGTRQNTEVWIKNGSELINMDKIDKKYFISNACNDSMRTFFLGIILPFKEVNDSSLRAKKREVSKKDCECLDSMIARRNYRR